MKLQPRLFALAGLAMSMCTPALLLADVTPAMDRIPASTPVVFTIKNASKFHASINNVATSLKLPVEEMAGLAHMEKMIKLDGVNGEGSAALAMLSLDNEKYADHPPLVLVLPVKDYAAMAKKLGGKGEGLEEVKIEDEPMFVKDLGGGFAVMGPIKEIVEKFEGKAGNSKAHETLMGTTGKAISDSSDAYLLADMKDVGPMMKKKVDEMKSQMDQMAELGAPGANPAGVAMFTGMVDGFIRDAASGVVGFKATDAGVSLDMGAQFKEGSEYAGYFSSKGKAGSLIGNLPKLDQGFLFAMAMDTSAPAIKTALKKMVEASKAGPEAANMFAGLNPLESVESMDGMAFCMGQTPALMGGLFLNTTMYVKSQNPAAYTKFMKDAMSSLNGKTVQGMTYQTTYEAGGAKVAEKPVDAWSMKFQMDQNNPAAAQIGQVQMMLFGPGGMGGYASQIDSGVVVTYAKNSELMGKALEAAKSGGGLNSDAGMKEVQAQLPADRCFEAQIGVKSIMETAIGFMGMMGGGPTNFNVPQDLPPIGMGATGASGGLRMTMFMPAKVMQTFKALGDSMNADGGEGGGGEK